MALLHPPVAVPLGGAGIVRLTDALLGVVFGSACTVVAVHLGDLPAGEVFTAQALALWAAVRWLIR